MVCTKVVTVLMEAKKISKKDIKEILNYFWGLISKFSSV